MDVSHTALAESSNEEAVAAFPDSASLQPPRLAIYASTTVARSGLSQVVDAVMTTPGLQAADLQELREQLDAAAEVVAVVVQVADAPRVLAVAQQYRLAVIAVADTLGAALGLVDLDRNADAPRCAVVFDHPNYAVPVAEQFAHCLQQLARGAEPNPRCLREPFANAPVAPRERELLALEVEGLSQRAMAERLVVVEGTIRVYLTRLRERLELPNAASIRAWAEAWWFAHHDVGRAVGQ